jgi:predicted secreted protein
MTTSALPGYGTLLKMGDGGSPETFATVVEVTEIHPPKIELQTEDATSHDSGGWEEVMGHLLSGGEIGAKVNWIPTDPTHDETSGLLYQILNRTKKNWRVVLPGSSKTFSFAALLTKFEAETPVKGKMAASVTLAISGAVMVS